MAMRVGGVTYRRASPLPSITRFNLGCQHSVTTMMGPIGLKTTASTDKEREAKLKTAESKKQERMTRRTKALAEEEKKKEEEGTTYEAGARFLRSYMVRSYCRGKGRCPPLGNKKKPL